MCVVGVLTFGPIYAMKTLVQNVRLFLLVCVPLMSSLKRSFFSKYCGVFVLSKRFFLKTCVWMLFPGPRLCVLLNTLFEHNDQALIQILCVILFLLKRYFSY